MAGVASATGIPLEDVAYDKDTSVLCPILDQSKDNGDDISFEKSLEEFRRSLSNTAGILNFSIKKAVRTSTYIYTVEELATELRLRIISAIEDHSFAADVLAAVELYNATLLQTPDFETSISASALISVRNPIAVHIPSSTMIPTPFPSHQFVNTASDEAERGRLTFGLSLSLSLFILLIAVALWWLFSRKKLIRKRIAVYITSDEGIDGADVQYTGGINATKKNSLLYSSMLDLPTSPVNRAFVYIKPHANVETVQDFIRGLFLSKHFSIVAEGRICGAELQRGFDWQYKDVYHRAHIQRPQDMALSSGSLMKFEKKFKIKWKVAIQQKLIRNSDDICSIFNICDSMFYSAWNECIRQDKLIKMGRGCYCGLIDTISNVPAIFCINGFYSAMRTEYITPRASVHYFFVEWDTASLSWSDFRKFFIGSTNPAQAHSESLRHIMNMEWENLNLESPLDMMKNGIHVSASAFEALCERNAWLNVPATCDPLGVMLFNLGFSATTIQSWISNAYVNGQPIYDVFENKSTLECCEVAKIILPTVTKYGMLTNPFDLLLFTCI